MSRYFASTARRVALQAAPRRAQAPVTAVRAFNSSTAAPAQPALQERHEASSGSGGVRSQAEWAQFGRDHIAHGLGRMRDEVVVKGEGLKLTTAEGREYLDFTAGIGVTNLGQ